MSRTGDLWHSIIVKQKIHISWLVIALSIASIVGILVGRFISWPFGSDLGIFLIVCLLVLTFLVNRIWAKILLVCLVGFLLGLVRTQSFYQHRLVYNQLVGKEIVIVGTLFDDVGTSRSNYRVLRLGNIEIAGKKLTGSILATTTDQTNLNREDRVTISGVTKEGIGGYNLQIIDAKIIARSHGYSLGLKLRNFFTNRLDSALSPLESHLAGAFLVGKRRNLPADFIMNLQIVGLTHLIVASGFHLSVIVRAMKRVLFKISRKSALFGAIFVIVLFNLITGLSPSMLRASIAAIVSLLCWYYGRNIHPLRLLVLIASATALFSPLYLWGDVAWALSFSSYFGVLILAPLIRQYFWGQTKLSFIKQLFTETLSAQICTFPISVFYFGNLSLVALLTNLLVVPVASITMALAFLSTLLSSLSPVALIAVWPLQIVLNYIIKVVNIFASMPLASVDVQVSRGFVLGCFVVIGATCLYMMFQNRNDEKLATFNIIE